MSFKETRNPSNWEITIDGDDIGAVNRVTGEVFSGTREAFNSRLTDEATALGGTSSIIGVAFMLPPYSAVLNSADATAKIEVSYDGTNFMEPSYEVDSAAVKLVTIGVNVSKVKFTGLTADTWSIY